MMLRFIKHFISVVICIHLFACAESNKKSEFSHHKLGYYYHVLAFSKQNKPIKANEIVWLNIQFKTQSDSVFWDSFNNLNDCFFVSIDSSSATNLLTNYISTCSLLDSSCMLIKTNIFFKQQFKNKKTPFFSKNDSIVKIFFKIKKVFNLQEFSEFKQDLDKIEQDQIKNYIIKFKDQHITKDSLGIYWIEKPKTRTAKGNFKTGDLLSIKYEGYFLNGRMIENSITNFEYRYGTPDQLIKGLNYVIKCLKKGEKAKIILTSHLAFGELGSMNQLIPPFTPLIYTIKINNLVIN